MKQKISVKGFVRLCLHDVKTGKDTLTPWIPNAITANGFQNYICGAIGAIAGSKTVGYLQVASQTDAPTSAQNTASGEFTATGARQATTNTFSANGTLQATASWATNQGNESALGAVAIYNTSSGGTAGSIATFSTSQKTTDQTLNITYQWRFS
jgi:hypothetical protein